MQNSSPIWCRIAMKIRTRPWQWPASSVAAVPVVAIVLAISGSAGQARDKVPFAPYLLAEGQYSSSIQNSTVGIRLPPPRPPEAPPRPEEIGKLGPGEERTIGRDAAVRAPSACQMRLTSEIAAVQALPPISSGECAAEDVLRLEAVMARDGRRIAISPPATLRCPMAEAVSHWVREELTSIAAELGAPLKSLMVDTSYECRSRNRVAGAKLSEHGRANAVDVRGFTLANGTVVELTDTGIRKE